MPGFDPDKYLAEKTAAGPFDPDKYLSEKMSAPQSTQGEAFIEGVGKGATFGLLPLAQAGVEKGVTKLANMAGMNLTDSPLSTLVQQYRDRGAQLREENPYTTMAGEIIGGVAPGAGISKGIGILGSKALPTAIKNLGMTKNVVSNVGPVAPTLNVFGKIARGATEGAAMGAAYTPDQGANFDQRLEQAKYGGAFGAAIPAAVEGTKALVSGGKNLAVKGFSAITGVNEDALKQFYANPQKYLDAPTREEIVSNIGSVVNDINVKVEQGKLTLTDAKQIYRDLVNQTKGVRRDAHKDAQEALRQGMNNLNDAFKGVVNDLNAKPAPTSLESPIAAAISDLKGQIAKGSDESLNILEADKRPYGVRGGAKVIRDVANEMNILPYEAQGASGLVPSNASYGAPKAMPARPFTPESRGVQSTLNSLADIVDSMPEAVPAKELKKILKQIDASQNAQYGQPGFDSRISQTYKLIRNVIDRGVKDNNPEYRAKMEEVARKMGIFEDAISNLGTPSDRLGKLASIDGTKGQLTIETLKKLGQETGNDFMGPIQDYIQTQKLLKDPKALEIVKKGLPQFSEVKNLEGLAKKAEKAKDIRSIARTTQNSLERRGVDLAQNALDEAGKVKRQFTGWTDGSVESKINQVMQGKNFIKGQLERLGKLSNQDFIDQVNKLKVNEAFQGSRTNGSRRAVVGGAVGSVIGGPIGTMIGAATGFMIDKHGPEMAKQAVLALSKINGTPTVQKLMQAGIKSQSAAQSIINALEKAVGAPASKMGSDAISRRLIGKDGEGDNFAEN